MQARAGPPWHLSASLSSVVVRALLCKEVVFDNIHDSKLKSAIQNGSSPADFLDLESFTDVVSQLKTAARAGSASMPAEDETSGQAAAAADHAFSVAFQMGHSAAKAKNDELAAVVRTLPLTDQERLQEALSSATRHVRQFVRLFVDDERAEAVAQDLANSVLGKLAKSDVVMVLYDIKNSGEPLTVPHLRVASFKSAHLKRCIARTHKTLGCPGDFPEQAVWMILDGQKAGNSTAILNQFTAGEDKSQGLCKNARQLHLVYDEASAQERLEAHARGGQNMPLQLLETCHVESWM